MTNDRPTVTTRAASHAGHAGVAQAESRFLFTFGHRAWAMIRVSRYIEIARARKFPPRRNIVNALSTHEIDSRLKKLSGWKLDAGKLARTYEFPDFRASLAFVNAVGNRAEEAGHHPDIDIRYNKVHLALVSHDAGGITAKDFELAEKINGLK